MGAGAPSSVLIPSVVKRPITKNQYESISRTPKGSSTEEWNLRLSPQPPTVAPTGRWVHVGPTSLSSLIPLLDWKSEERDAVHKNLAWRNLNKESLKKKGKQCFTALLMNSRRPLESKTIKDQGQRSKVKIYGKHLAEQRGHTGG